MAVPTTAWSELLPADTELVSSGDDRIRELKTQIREIVDVDHKFESSGKGADWGYHKKLTLVEQASDPAAIASAAILYAKQVGGKAELHVRDEDGNIIQITDSGEVIAGMDDEVRMFYGTLAEIPNGWALADGVAGRPNLLAKFVRGINTAGTQPEANSKAGDTIGLTSANLPSHTHSTASSGTHDHYALKATGGTSAPQWILNTGALGGAYWSTAYSTSDGAHTHTVSTEGSNPTINLLPVYFSLAFIVKT